MNDELTSRAGFLDSLPTVFGYIGIGVAFGIVGHAAGFSTWLVALNSILLYAGSSQFVMVTMLAAHSSIAATVFSVFLVNARMILMSTTLTPYFKNESLFKNIWVGTLLTDESFALGMNKLNYTNHKLSFTWFNTVNVVSYTTWVVSSILGAAVGGLIPDPNRWGINFALTAMFIGLLCLQIMSDKTIKLKLQLVIVLFVLFATYFGLIFVPANILILLVTLLACGLGVVLKHVNY